MTFYSEGGATKLFAGFLSPPRYPPREQYASRGAKHGSLWYDRSPRSANLRGSGSLLPAISMTRKRTTVAIGRLQRSAFSSKKSRATSYTARCAAHRRSNSRSLNMGAHPAISPAEKSSVSTCAQRLPPCIDVGSQSNLASTCHEFRLHPCGVSAGLHNGQEGAGCDDCGHDNHQALRRGRAT
jgi:hypothetical protein